MTAFSPRLVNSAGREAGGWQGIRLQAGGRQAGCRQAGGRQASNVGALELPALDDRIHDVEV